jgi:competence protein ComEC
MERLKIPTIAGVLSVLILALVTVFSSSVSSEVGMLEVVFLDVGQGDATLIESPTGTQVLIDGGKGSMVLTSLGHEIDFFDRDIDMIIATHPDADHIGGLIDVLLRYNVHTVVMTENESDTPVFDSFKKVVEEEGAEIIYARRGQVFDLGSGESGSTTLSILFPDRDPSGLESNMSSIVARLVYGESEFMLTGDSPQQIEEYLVSLGGALRSDVLKLGHHGSRTSTSPIFLNAVNPTYAVISAGQDNSYGHPHKEVTELLTREGVAQKNTAESGSISFVSDGVSLFLK